MCVCVRVTGDRVFVFGMIRVEHKQVNLPLQVEIDTHHNQQRQPKRGGGGVKAPSARPQGGESGPFTELWRSAGWR